MVCDRPWLSLRIGYIIILVMSFNSSLTKGIYSGFLDQSIISPALT